MSDKYGMVVPFNEAAGLTIRWLSPDENILTNGRVEFVSDNTVLFEIDLPEFDEFISTLKVVAHNAKATEQKLKA